MFAKFATSSFRNRTATIRERAAQVPYPLPHGRGSASRGKRVTNFRGAVLTALLLSSLIAFPRGVAAGDRARGAEREESFIAALFFPRLKGPMTRVTGTLRPFLVTPGIGVGLLADVSIEHYFARPVVLGVELRPLALVGERGAFGAIGHLRGTFGYAGDYLGLGLLCGGQFQHYGVSGVSLGASLRLGALDGLNLQFAYGHSLIRGYYTGELQFALDHFLLEIALPLHQRLRLLLSGGYGMDLWAYATIGLRQILRGSGGRGTVALSGALGAALVVDRFPCQYSDPLPCQNAAIGYGPTIATGLDARF